jgi:ribosome biogenesis GTPase
VYSLQDLGWSPFFQQQTTESLNGVFPARVSEQSRGIYKLVSERAELTATVAGRLAFEAEQSTAMPVAGDWVLARPASDGQAVIERVLERRTKLSRIAPSDQQRLTEE